MIIISIYKHFNFSLLLKLKLDKFLLIDSSKINSIHKSSKDEAEINNTPFIKSQVVYNSFLLGSFLNFLINFLIVLFIAFPHINNRVISTTPIFYIFCAEEISKYASMKSFYKKGFFILAFFISYSIVGCIFHPGSYVFT